MNDTDVIKYIDKTYPEMSKRFKEILEEEWKLFCRKQYDYGSSNITLGENMDTKEGRMVSLTGLVIRMNDKIHRLKNIIIKNNGKNAVKNETYLDAFIGLSIYGIIARLGSEAKWGK